jgi:hypothetical protein
MLWSARRQNQPAHVLIMCLRQQAEILMPQGLLDEKAVDLNELDLHTCPMVGANCHSL